MRTYPGCDAAERHATCDPMSMWLSLQDQSALEHLAGTLHEWAQFHCDLQSHS